MEEPGLSEELSGHPDWSFYGSIFGKYGLLAERDRVSESGRQPLWH